MENANGIGIEATENMQVQGGPEQIGWKDMTDFVDRPVYEAKSGKWHILRGYKQYGTKKEVFLSDEKETIAFESIALYPTDTGILKVPSFVNDGKKFGK